MIRSVLISIALAISIGGSVIAWGADRAEVPYPEGYRTWLHVKSDVVTKDHPRFEAVGGYLHIYANELAERGYRAGAFPDGSVIACDNLEAQAKPGIVVEGPRRWLAVMRKDSEKYKSTGGWGFDIFSHSSKTDRDVPVNPIENCFACHTQRKDADYVFSKLRD